MWNRYLIPNIISGDQEATLTEIQEGDTMYSICSYVAENDDAMSLVEGERVYVLGKGL